MGVAASSSFAMAALLITVASDEELLITGWVKKSTFFPFAPLTRNEKEISPRFFSIAHAHSYIQRRDAYMRR